MNAGEMQVHLHRLYRDGKDQAANRIRYAGGLAFRYWTRQGAANREPVFACLIACETQAIVEGHDFTTKSNQWKEPIEWRT